jgi:hypothetical protein
VWIGKRPGADEQVGRMNRLHGCSRSTFCLVGLWPPRGSIATGARAPRRCTLQRTGSLLAPAPGDFCSASHLGGPATPRSPINRLSLLQGSSDRWGARALIRRSRLLQPSLAALGTRGKADLPELCFHRPSFQAPIAAHQARVDPFRPRPGSNERDYGAGQGRRG